MVFKKSFPKSSDKTVYPKWEEITLSEDEERQQEDQARRDNIRKMHESIADARVIIETENLKPFQTDMINMAIALFEKRSSHEIFYKENRAKEKFDTQAEK